MEKEKKGLSGHSDPPPETAADTGGAQTNATLLDTAFFRGGAHAPDALASPEAGRAEIKIGDLLLGTYRVESGVISGGMGRVWKVRHTGWDMALAMKQPRATHFRNEQQRADFVWECEAWMELGMHPHIVSCYYVRDIGGIPSVFSEWMEGGSLKNWIASGKLYAGGPRAAVARILDIAIQTARGLHYIHERRDDPSRPPRGQIHQDVKPGNLLLSPEGEAKVADFGIAHAYALRGAQFADATIASKHGAYTAAYCSPEQLDGQVLSRRTDIYSWAATLLEMFLGQREWERGPDLAAARGRCLAMEMRAPLPKGMDQLLWHCLEEAPEKRPHDFGEIEDTLARIYADATWEIYPRRAENAAASTADNHNNRALSYLDLGKPNDALLAWNSALATTHGYPEALYNSLLLKIRTGALSAGKAADEFADENASPEKAHLADALRAELSTIHIEISPDAKPLGEFEAGREVHSPDGRYVLKDRFNSVEVFDLHTGEPVHVFHGCRPVAGKNRWDNGQPWFAENGRLVLLTDTQAWILADADGSNLLTFRGNYKPRKAYRRHGGIMGGMKISCVALSKDGNLALSCGPDFCAVLWNANTGRPIRVFRHPDQADPTLVSYTGPYNHTGFWESENAVYAIQGVSEGQLMMVWDMVSGQLLGSTLLPKTDEFYPLKYVRPVALDRPEPAPYLLSAVRKTQALKQQERLHEQLINEATRAHRAGNAPAARKAIAEAMSLPGYENRSEDIRLYQTLHAGCEKTGLHSMLPHILLSGSTLAEIKRMLNAPDATERTSLPADDFPALKKKAERELARMLEAFRAYMHPKYNEVEGDRIGDGEYKAWLLEADVSLDGTRVAFGVMMQVEFRFHNNPIYTKEVHFGALVYDTRSGSLAAKFQRLKSDVVYNENYGSIGDGRAYANGYNFYRRHDLLCPFTVHLDSAGKRLLVASKDLSVVELSTGAQRDLNIKKAIRYARFLHDDRLVFYFAEDGVAGVADAETGEEWNRATFKDAERQIRSITLLNDDIFLVNSGARSQESWLLHWQYKLDDPAEAK